MNPAAVSGGDAGEATTVSFVRSASLFSARYFEKAQSGDSPSSLGSFVTFHQAPVMLPALWLPGFVQST